MSTLHTSGRRSPTSVCFTPPQDLAEEYSHTPRTDAPIPIPPLPRLTTETRQVTEGRVDRGATDGHPERCETADRSAWYGSAVSGHGDRQSEQGGGVSFSLRPTNAGNWRVEGRGTCTMFGITMPSMYLIPSYPCNAWILPSKPLIRVSNPSQFRSIPLAASPNPSCTPLTTLSNSAFSSPVLLSSACRRLSPSATSLASACSPLRLLKRARRGGKIGNNGSKRGRSEKRDCSSVNSAWDRVTFEPLSGWVVVVRERAAAAARSRSTRRSLTRREMASRCRGWVRRERRWSSFPRVGRRGEDT